MIAFNKPRNRIEKKSSKNKLKLKLKLKSLIENSAMQISPIEDSKNPPLEISNIEFEKFEIESPKKFQSLDEIFQPTETGRTISATRTRDGVAVQFRDGDELPSPDDHLLEVLKNSGATVYEYSARFASLLVANNDGNGSSKPTFIVRWVEHRRPNASEPSRSWALITSDAKFWRQVVCEAGHKWRQRLTAPMTFLLPPGMVRDHACVTDGDED